MSGGSFSYLYNKDAQDLFNYKQELEDMETFLIKRGDIDIAKDIRRLLEYLYSAENRIDVLKSNLRDVFHAVEWYVSADYGDESLQKSIDKYRGELKEGKQ